MGRQSLDFDTPVNLLPEYKGFKGPGDWLDGITFGEFVQCLTIFESLAEADAEGVAEGYADIARVLYHIPENLPCRTFSPSMHRHCFHRYGRDTGGAD